MHRFFRLAQNRRSSFNMLVLINPAPQIPSRSFSAISRATATRSNIDFEQQREEALQRHSLSNLKLQWPKTADAETAARVDYRVRNPKSIRQMYGEADLSKLEIFQGGFINFGYWPKLMPDHKQITIAERENASKELYRLVCDFTGTLHGSNVLEVGSGLGYGSSFISEHYQPRLVVGLDISPDQIARAKKHQTCGTKSGKLRFALGEAESMPFTDQAFDVVLSIEAAQHFRSMRSFVQEASRVLKPGGKLITTSFFPTSEEGVDALNAIIPDYHIHGSQSTVDDVKEEFSSHMQQVAVTSIGKNVWHGFSRWLDQIGYQHQWSKIWPALYEKGLIDYMVFSGKSPDLVENDVLQETPIAVPPNQHIR